METVVPEDSPLAAYIEGEGQAEPYIADESHDDPNSTLPKGSYAPTGIPTLLAKIPQPIPTQFFRSNFISKVRELYAYLVTSTLGPADNERFLEHFRYTIIASQLLDEHVGSHQPSSFAPSDNITSPETFTNPASALTLSGVLLTAAVAYVLVKTIDWVRGGRFGTISKGRMVVATCILAILGLLIFAYVRRQWLQYLRHQAIAASSTLVANTRSLDVTASSGITLVQEVELVSRGYRISTPLPPISRLESKGQVPRCQKLRRRLRRIYAVSIPALIRAADNLRILTDLNDLERFLEVYDLRVEDLQEAFQGETIEDDDESGSLKTLRVLQYRFGTLRRFVLCCLLSLPVTGRQADSVRWRSAVNEMTRLSSIFGEASQDLIQILREEEHTNQKTAPTTIARSPTTKTNNSNHTRLQSQVRRLSNLSVSMRSLQAKLYLLRDDTSRALTASNVSEYDLNILSASLREQYESLGGDLKLLLEDWEAGKASLSGLPLRRISTFSDANRLSLSSSISGPRSPSVWNPSGAGLGVVTEGETTSRAQALRALTGSEGGVNFPISPPVSLDNSSNDGNGDDEAVFEAIAAPRQRSSLTREQRIAKMHEEREAATARQASREVNTNMVRELQNVISSRAVPNKRVSGRMMSM